MFWDAIKRHVLIIFLIITLSENYNDKCVMHLQIIASCFHNTLGEQVQNQSGHHPIEPFVLLTTVSRKTVTSGGEIIKLYLMIHKSPFLNAMFETRCTKKKVFLRKQTKVIDILKQLSHVYKLCSAKLKGVSAYIFK